MDLMDLLIDTIRVDRYTGAAGGEGRGRDGALVSCLLNRYVCDWIRGHVFRDKRQQTVTFRTWRGSSQPPFWSLIFELICRHWPSRNREIPSQTADEFFDTEENSFQARLISIRAFLFWSFLFLWFFRESCQMSRGILFIYFCLLVTNCDCQILFSL